MVLGAAGLAIGMGFQGSLSNLAAGVLLLVFRPYKVGQYVTVGGNSGTVEELGLFTTTLTIPDNIQIVVPNGSIFGAVIENYSHLPIRRVNVPVGVSYDADIDETRKVLEKAAASVPGIKNDPKPQVFLSGLGASSVDWYVRVWCDNADYWATWENTMRSIKRSLDEAGIGIPYPQMDVHLMQESKNKTS